MDFLGHKNIFTELVTPQPSDHALWIHQKAWFSIGSFDKDTNIEYDIKAKGNGVFAMVIQGKFNVSGIALDRRDGLGLWETDTINIKALSDDARMLLIDVPMQF
jgi:redox-sensitive bicupin YhaK (pirin superfamily)